MNKDSAHLAVWSGPRNISTALMRAWENRDDCWVVDEPLYGHYLTQVQVTHPAVAEVIASQENDWQKVVDGLTGPIPHRRQIYYQKHMAHHLLGVRFQLPGRPQGPLQHLAFLRDVRRGQASRHACGRDRG